MRACCNSCDAFALDRGGRAPLRAHPRAARRLAPAGRAGRAPIPVAQGRSPPEFLAQGFDAVLLADEWPGGRGLAWARELAGRAGFAPLVLLCGQDPVASRARPRRWVPVSVAARGARPRGVRARADGGRAAPVARARGLAHQRRRARHAALRRRLHPRLSPHPPPRQRATSDLYLGRERARRHAGGAQGGPRPPARARSSRSIPSGASCRSTRLRSASRAPRSCGCYDLGVSDEHAWLVMEYFARGDLRRRMRARAHAARGAAVRRRHRPRARRDARRRRAAPGSEARQRHAARRRQHRAHRFRPVQGRGAGARHHRDRHDLRHAALHEPGAGARRADRRAQRPVQPRRHPVRDADAARSPTAPRIRWRSSTSTARSRCRGCRRSSPQVQPVLERLLAKDPADRYASAPEAAAALESTLARWRSRAAASR